MKTKEKIDKGRVEGICEDIKEVKTLRKLKEFLQQEIRFVDEEIEQRE